MIITWMDVKRVRHTETIIQQLEFQGYLWLLVYKKKIGSEVFFNLTFSN